MRFLKNILMFGVLLCLGGCTVYNAEYNPYGRLNTNVSVVGVRVTGDIPHEYRHHQFNRYWLGGHYGTYEYRRKIIYPPHPIVYRPNHNMYNHHR